MILEEAGGLTFLHACGDVGQALGLRVYIIVFIFTEFAVAFNDNPTTNLNSSKTVSNCTLSAQTSYLQYNPLSTHCKESQFYRIPNFSLTIEKM